MRKAGRLLRLAGCILRSRACEKRGHETLTGCGVLGVECCVASDALRIYGILYNKYTLEAARARARAIRLR